MKKYYILQVCDVEGCFAIGLTDSKSIADWWAQQKEGDYSTYEMNTLEYGYTRKPYTDLEKKLEKRRKRNANV